MDPTGFQLWKFKTIVPIDYCKVQNDDNIILIKVSENAIRNLV